MANSAFEQKQTGNASTTAAGSVEIATPAQVAARTAVGETGATLAVSPADLPEADAVDIEFTAGHDLDAGVPVGISEMVETEPTVGKARSAVLTANHGIGATIGNALLTNDTNKDIGGGKVARVIHNTTNIYVQVVQTNKTTPSISCGTAQSVITTGAAFYALCALNDDKFAVFYNDASSVNDIKYRVCTVSGTTITLGAQGTFFTAASTLATGKIAADQIGTDKGVVFMKAATTTSTRVIAFTVSGDVITAGTPVTPSAEQQVNEVGSVRKIGTDKFILGTPGTNRVDFQVGTISGTTITLGTGANTSATGAPAALAFVVESHTADAFVCKYRKVSSTMSFVVGTVSGTTITLGTPFDGANVTGGVGWMVVKSPTKVWQSSGGYGVHEFTISGTTIEGGRAVYYRTSGAPPVGLTNLFLILSSGYWVWFNGNWNATYHEFLIEGLSVSNFIGVTQQTVNSGEPVIVRVTGLSTVTAPVYTVDGRSYGLSPGTYYVVSDGSFTATSSDISAADSYAELDIVRAISPTQVLLN